MDAFGEHYHHQIERYYRESIIGTMDGKDKRSWYCKCVWVGSALACLTEMQAKKMMS
jgi:hypothetical protein